MSAKQPYRSSHSIQLDAGSAIGGRFAIGLRFLLRAVLGLAVAAGAFGATQHLFAHTTRAEAAPCTAIAFGAAPTTSSIASAGATQCFTFSGATGGRIRIRTVETSGSLLAKVT